ncbi:MAG TPA: hypothetical protein PKM63_12615 [Panacibacter sp.]|nr:hypothetical protein [Panacibacter sp.]HNP45123.1 hypothetical protein [Panacibacter sp.]
MKLLCLVLLCFFLNTQNIYAQVSGCPDPAANNYDSAVTVNNGSCTYDNGNLKPAFNYNLSTVINETSGLVYWKKKIWTHNDSGGEPAVYQLNRETGSIERTIIINNAINVDWEDIAQDNRFFYIGDFGNNAKGNREDLRIYKVAKGDVAASDTITAEIINFAYSDQNDFTTKPQNTTDFDCEALIAYGDSLYLFSKDWTDNKTRLYKLPNKAGSFTAEKIGELDVKGLITGAEILADQRVIVLTGYNSTLSPFIYMLYDFSGDNFFGANKRKVALNQSFTQVEGICAQSPTKFFISNEKYSQLIINTPAKMQTLNLSKLLNPYYQEPQQQAIAAPHIVFASLH